MKIPKHRPMCAVCGHPVEHFYVSRNPYLHSYILRAECHGDREDVEIDDVLWMEAMEINLTEAFQHPAIEKTP